MTGITKLGWVAQAIVPQRDKPTDLSGPIPWVRIEDFDGKYLSSSRSGQGVTTQQVSSMPLRVFPPGTVVTSCSCVMGSTAIVREYLVTNQTFIGLIPDATKLLSDYLYYYFLASQQHLQARASGSIQQYLSKDEFLSLRLALPDLDEQRRIADFLDDRVARIDQMITARRAQMHLLDAAAKSQLAASALSGQDLMPLRYLIVDERLGLWGQDAGVDEMDVKVARVADFHRPEFRLGEVTTVRSAPASQVQARLLRHGDVLLERSGGTQRNPVGCPVFVDSPSSLTVSSNFVSRLRPAEDVDGRYLSLIMGALYATRQQEPHSNQTTGIQNLNTASYFRIEVPQRSLEEQKALGEAMDATLTETRQRQASLTESIDTLVEYKQSLITAAVSGELDVSTAGSGIPG